MWFPINLTKVRGIPINNHPGAYGALRRHDIHTGVDLYVDERDWVFAMESGIVVKKERFTGTDDCKWWKPTDCVVVKSESRFLLYGEIESDLKVGDAVVQGQKIGDVVPVLPVEKIRSDIPEHSNCMLHLECMDLTYDCQEFPVWTTFENKPNYLLDPTPFLIYGLKRRHQQINFLTL